jgi:hypothetical protein
VPRPVNLELCKAVFRGSPHRLENKQHAHRFACGLGRQSLAHEPGGSYAEQILVCRAPLTWNFARPCSGARRATWYPTTRSACRIGRQFFACELAAATPNESPWLRAPRWPESSCRLAGHTIGQTPAKQGSSRRLAVLPESNNTFSVPDRATIPCARTGCGFAEWIVVAPRPR